MKIRSGFVSNSSTSSFVLLGYRLDDAFLDELKKNGVYPSKENRGECSEESEETFMHDCWELPDDIEIKTPDEDEKAIGISIRNQTVAELKGKSKILKDFFKTKKDPVVLGGSYYC